MSKSKIAYPEVAADARMLVSNSPVQVRVPVGPKVLEKIITAYRLAGMNDRSVLASLSATLVESIHSLAVEARNARTAAREAAKAAKKAQATP